MGTQNPVEVQVLSRPPEESKKSPLEFKGAFLIKIISLNLLFFLSALNLYYKSD